MLTTFFKENEANAATETPQFSLYSKNFIIPRKRSAAYDHMSLPLGVVAFVERNLQMRALILRGCRV